MQATKIKINGSSFLLPLSHSSNYDFLLITENKDDIIKCVEAYKQWLKNPLQDMPIHPNMRDFKEITGIIGVPFDMRDVDLYVIDKNIDIILEVDI